jgi:DNA-directed RNA polymerase subunit RPC12/RpoP
VQKTENSKAVSFVCLNCKTTNVGWQGADGLTRVKCEKCGTSVQAMEVVKRVCLPVYAPEQVVRLFARS